MYIYIHVINKKQTYVCFVYYYLASLLSILLICLYSFKFIFYYFSGFHILNFIVVAIVLLICGFLYLCIICVCFTFILSVSL